MLILDPWAAPTAIEFQACGVMTNDGLDVYVPEGDECNSRWQRRRK